MKQLDEFESIYRKWAMSLPVECNRSDAPSLREARKALMILAKEAAHQLNISQQAYSALELSEHKGTITLNRLRIIAEALGCEFHYIIRPKGGQLFSRIVWDREVAGVLRSLPMRTPRKLWMAMSMWARKRR